MVGRGGWLSTVDPLIAPADRVVFRDGRFDPDDDDGVVPADDPPDLALSIDDLEAVRALAVDRQRHIEQLRDAVDHSRLVLHRVLDALRVERERPGVS